MSRFFNALEKLIFLMLIFSIPFQTRTFLFGPHSPIEEPEKFVEWNSAFFYFTDILMLGLLAVLVFRVFCEKFLGKGEFILAEFLKITKSFKIPLIFLFAFIFFSGLSLLNAQFLDYSAYRFVKLFGYVFVFLYTATRINFGFNTVSKYKLNFKWVIGVFLASGVFQSVIAVLQFAKQQSIGLTKLHESPLNIGMREVAHIKSAFGPVSFGEPIGEYMDMIRAYGTFPSPNVLAGFLGICLLLGLYLFISEYIRREATKQLKLFKESKGVLRAIFRTLKKNTPFFAIFGLFILFEGFILTFSRGAAFFLAISVFIFFAGLFFFKMFEAQKTFILKSFFIIGFIWAISISLTFPELSSRFFTSSASEDSIRERAYYNKIGMESVSRAEGNALFGVGIGNFVSDYMENFPKLKLYMYQPVHNIYLLIASEVGLLGAGAFILFLGSLIAISARRIILAKKNDENDVLLLGTILISTLFMVSVGMYDHYFWTLQQGSLMFWVILGLLFGTGR